MNNDLPPSLKFEKVVTINCEFSLFGLIIHEVLVAKELYSVLQIASAWRLSKQDQLANSY